MPALEHLENKSLSVAERIAAAGELGNRIAKEDPVGAAWSAVCEVAHDDSDHPEVRKAALGAMARARAAAVNQLVRPFRDPQRLVRKEAVRLLRSIGASHEGRLTVALQRIKAGDSLALANLALSFGYDPRIVAAFREATADANPRVRALGLAGLAQVGEMADVVSGLSDPEPEVRASAAEQAGYYSTLEQTEIAALQSLLNDPVKEVAQAARTALKRLGAIPVGKPRGTREGTKPAAPEGEWQRLLSSLSKAALDDPDYPATLDDEVVDSGWLGFPGATDAEIAELSRRLGRTLPASYEAFLRVSNGFRRISPFIELVWPTGEVRAFSTDNSHWIDAYRKSLPPICDEEHRRYGDKQDCVAFDARYLSTAIQVSEVGDGVLLLNPAVLTSDGEWEAWFFANWLPGAKRYPSFGELMRAAEKDNVDQ